MPLTTQTGQAAPKEVAITALLKQEVRTAGNLKTIQNQVIIFHQQVQTQKLRHTEVVALVIATGQLQQALLQEAIPVAVSLDQVATLAHQAEAATQEVAQAAEVQAEVATAEAALVEVVLVEVAQEEAIVADQALRAAEDSKQLN